MPCVKTGRYSTAHARDSFRRAILPICSFFNGAMRRVRSYSLYNADFAVPYLDESNIGSLLTEALTANVEAVFADQTGLVSADTAVKKFVSRSSMFLLSCPSFVKFLQPSKPTLSHVIQKSAREERTRRGHPFRRCVGESSRRIRET